MAPIALAGAVVLGLVGVAIFGLGARECWFAIRVYLGDPTPIASAVNDPGPVKLQGTAQPDEGTVTAPFSGAKCLVCEWEVQQSETEGRGDVHWKTLDQGLRGGPFRLVDETASCRVEPAGSVRHFEEHVVTVPAGTELPDRLRAFVASNPAVESQAETVDIGLTKIFLGNEQRFVERRLDPGEDCYVYGYAHYDSTAGSRGGEVNLRVDGDGVRRFLIADSRERGVAWEQIKIGIVPVLIGLCLLVIAGALLL
jgi:hypothetical protein